MSGFFSSSGCVLLKWSPRLSLSSFLSFSPSPLGPMGSLWGGAVVVRGHLGDILGFPIDIWNLGYNGCCVLTCCWEILPTAVSLLSLFGSSNKLMHLSLTSRRLGWLTRSSGTAICWLRAELGHRRRAINSTLRSFINPRPEHAQSGTSDEPPLHGTWFEHNDCDCYCNYHHKRTIIIALILPS